MNRERMFYNFGKQGPDLSFHEQFKNSELLMIHGLADFFDGSAMNSRSCWGSFAVTSPCLIEEMMTECASVDRTHHGFSIMGDIERPQRCPLFMKNQDVMPIERMLPRAWEIRKKIVSRANAVPVSDNLRAIWDATIDDVKLSGTFRRRRRNHQVPGAR